MKIQSTLNPEPRLARLEVWPDLHNERAGYWRLFWAVPGESTMVTAIGYCSPGGTPDPHGTRNGEPDRDGGYALKHRWL